MDRFNMLYGGNNTGEGLIIRDIISDTISNFNAHFKVYPDKRLGLSIFNDDRLNLSMAIMKQLEVNNYIIRKDIEEESYKGIDLK